MVKMDSIAGHTVFCNARPLFSTMPCYWKWDWIEEVYYAVPAEVDCPLKWENGENGIKVTSCDI